MSTRVAAAQAAGLFWEMGGGCGPQGSSPAKHKQKPGPHHGPSVPRGGSRVQPGAPGADAGVKLAGHEVLPPPRALAAVLGQQDALLDLMGGGCAGFIGGGGGGQRAGCIGAKRTALLSAMAIAVFWMPRALKPKPQALSPITEPMTRPSRAGCSRRRPGPGCA